MIDLAFIGLMYIGTKYHWGGNTVEQGLDCSGFACLCLRSMGYINSKDFSAQEIYNEFSFFRQSWSEEPARNDLLFFGHSPRNITHVAIALDGKYLVESAGEGREETDKGEVRIRPIGYRDDLVAVVRIQR